MYHALVFSVLLPSVGGSSSDYLSAKRKFEMIQQDQLRPGSKVSLSARELNAFVVGEVAEVAPAGVRNPKVELGEGTASGSALIDFVKVRQAQGKPPNWFLGKLLAGEHPVTVTARIQSQAGKATVEVERVEISGLPIEGGMLDFLINKYFLPYFPDAKVGEPFMLSHRIDRLEVKPNAVGVIIGR